MAMLAQKDMVTDEKMRASTGREPAEWFALLDAEQATTWTHTRIAAWLREVHHVPAWWNQAVTVRYEQARGMREPGQKADGTYTATTTKVVDLLAQAALDGAIVIVTDSLGADPASVNREAKAPNARWKLQRRERLLLTSTPSGERTSVGLTWSGVVDPALLAEAKAQIKNLVDAIAAASETKN